MENLDITALLASTEFAVAAAVVFVAGFMRGFVGVGSGMLMAPVFAILFGPVSTVGMIILLDLVVTIQLLPSVYRMINWRLIFQISLAATVFMPVGSWVLVNVDTELMTRGIALVVLVLVLILLSGWRYRGPRRPAVSAGVGTVSGVLMAATSLGNPPVILYLLSGSDTAATNRANFTGYFCITLLALLALMLAKGLIGVPTLTRAAALLPVYVVAAWGGARCFQRTNEQLYRRVALGLLLGVAVYGLLR